MLHYGMRALLLKQRKVGSNTLTKHYKLDEINAALNK